MVNAQNLRVYKTISYWWISAVLYILVWFPRYSDYRSTKIREFSYPNLFLATPQIRKIDFVSCRVACFLIGSATLLQCWRVTDGQTDRQTGQANRQCIMRCIYVSHRKSITTPYSHNQLVITRSSAVAEGPRDSPSRMKVLLNSLN